MNVHTESDRPLGPAAHLRAAWNVHPPTGVLVAVMLGLLALFAVGLVLDDRVVTGAPVWLKPTKFAISIALYSATILWMLSLLPARGPWTTRFVRIFGWTVVITFAVEMLAIVGQAARAVPSHFNVATPLDTIVWSAMGTAVVVLFVANLALAGVLLTTRFATPSMRWAVRLGVVVAVVGMAQAFLMTSPTAQQMADWEAGEPVTLAGAHAVGLRDGGPGLPVVGWSTEGGDLRAGHFVGIHALQVLPFAALLLARRRRLHEVQRTRLVMVLAGGYLGLTALVTWQALRAQPLLRPDALTLGVLGALLLVTLAGAAWSLRRPHSRPRARDAVPSRAP